MPGEDIQSWSTTATSNANADTSINWAEGQPRASVNNSARSMMAAHAKDRNLKNGSIATTGTADAYAVASGLGYTSVPTNLQMRLLIHTANTGPSTLNMDGIGAQPIVRAAAGAPLVLGDLTTDSYADFHFNGTSWVLLRNYSTDYVTSVGGVINGTLTVNVAGSFGAAHDTSIEVASNLPIIGFHNPGLAYTKFGLNAAGNFSFGGGNWPPDVFQVDTGGSTYATGTVNGGNVTAAGAVVAGTNGYKPGGGLWADTSDARVKTVANEYTTGLSAIKQLVPVRYSFKGNDGEHTANGKQYIGLIAQDVETIMPEMVTTKAGKIDGKPVSDLRVLDTGALIYALVNSVQELSARLEALEAR